MTEEIVSSGPPAPVEARSAVTGWAKLAEPFVAAPAAARPATAGEAERALTVPEALADGWFVAELTGEVAVGARCCYGRTPELARQRLMELLEAAVVVRTPQRAFVGLTGKTVTVLDVLGVDHSYRDTPWQVVGPSGAVVAAYADTAAADATVSRMPAGHTVRHYLLAPKPAYRGRAFVDHHGYLDVYDLDTGRLLTMTAGWSNLLKVEDPEKGAVVYEVRRCRVCGCRDEDCQQCIAATGAPCSWVQPDLCSRCA